MRRIVQMQQMCWRVVCKQASLGGVALQLRHTTPPLRDRVHDTPVERPVTAISKQRVCVRTRLDACGPECGTTSPDKLFERLEVV